ncbi:hypothetical protein L1987_85898 [Smallanthus sonchifolius]|uniref:Uncharacterized protein n=1 Tax=Smallanthus sonchifolius TaxID=185202 RepID=A0ACB8XYJ3_9ASTR|nr:hypothetical protein L1987_85898 [Smallanthus sonchifolius]
MATEDKVHESIRILIEGESSRPNHSKQSNVTICMVPDSLRKLNPHAYTPRIISIGPLHKDDAHLRAMEEHKVTYMYRLFHRTVQSTKKDMEQITRKCVQAILGSVTRARACYAPSFTCYDDSKLAEIMVIDGCFILELLYRPRATKRGPIPTISYSATEIVGAGVRFKAQRDENSLLAVKFKHSFFVPGLVSLCVRDTCFKIPVLSIKNSTPSLLRNLIAYEQCYPLSRHYITSFAFLMDRLIDTKDDVSLLVRSKVLQHNLGASEDVTSLFNNICNGVVLRDFYYTDEWRKLDEYCNQFWPSILISLRRLYRSTTWKTLTVIAAMIIFAVTLFQTIYTVQND